MSLCRDVSEGVVVMMKCLYDANLDVKAGNE